MSLAFDLDLPAASDPEAHLRRALLMAGALPQDPTKATVTVVSKRVSNERLMDRLLAAQAAARRARAVALGTQR